LSQISAELYLRNYIFDFATKYYWDHPEIKSIADFNFTSSDFDDFKNLLLSRKFSYKTQTEETFHELVANAKKEKYYDAHRDLFDMLEKDLSHSLEKDLELFHNEILSLLEDEIISRYFYEEGALAWSVKEDKQVLKAVDVLRNKDLYTSILNGSSGLKMLTTGSSSKGFSYGEKMVALENI
jgi:carboxyl-terminal processing protease